MLDPLSPTFTVDVLALGIIAGWLFVWSMHLIAILYGKYRLHRKVLKFPAEHPYLGVSVLKPLMGVDPHLVGNLETFFTLTYPKFELLICVEDESDPAIMIAKSLIEKYPGVDAKLFIGGEDVGVNPKINNMQPGYKAAKYELIMISDSGIRVKEDTLIDMTSHMRDDIALVHQMPFTCDRDGFSATFEKIFFGTVQSRIYLTAEFFSIICHTGMSTLMRKKLIDEVGGIRAFGCYLAEDYFFAKSLRDRGWKSSISSQPALQNSGICEVTSFQRRLIRWTKLRIAMIPFTIILEPLSECLILGAIAALSVNYLFQWDALVFYLVHILVWFLLDWILLSTVQAGSVPFNKFDYVIGWLFRECIGPYLFLCALLDPTIQWRSRTFRLRWGGIAEEVKPKIKL